MDWDALKQRSPELYHVAHDGCTEREYSGKYVHTTDRGVYCCAVCDAPLFSSEDKFNSATGWPSFIAPISKRAVRLQTETDYGMESTQIYCTHCSAYLGRVFHDGPRKLWRIQNRYSLNSVSLVFKKHT